MKSLKSMILLQIKFTLKPSHLKIVILTEKSCCCKYKCISINSPLDYDITEKPKVYILPRNRTLFVQQIICSTNCSLFLTCRIRMIPLKILFI